MICIIFACKIRKMAETFIIGVLIIAISVAMLSVKVIFLKDGKFSSQHVKDNPGLRRQKIHCVMEQDREARTMKIMLWLMKKNK